MLDLKYVTLESQIYTLSRFTKQRKYLPKEKQIIKKVIGHIDQVVEVENKFFKEINDYVDYLNNKECDLNEYGEVDKPKYFCKAHLTYEHPICTIKDKMMCPIIIY